MTLIAFARDATSASIATMLHLALSNPSARLRYQSVQVTRTATTLRLTGTMHHPGRAPLKMLVVYNTRTVGSIKYLCLTPKRVWLTGYRTGTHNTKYAHGAHDHAMLEQDLYLFLHYNATFRIEM